MALMTLGGASCLWCTRLHAHVPAASLAHTWTKLQETGDEAGGAVGLGGSWSGRGQSSGHVLWVKERWGDVKAWAASRSEAAAGSIRWARETIVRWIETQGSDAVAWVAASSEAAASAIQANPQWRSMVSAAHAWISSAWPTLPQQSAMEHEGDSGGGRAEDLAEGITESVTEGMEVDRAHTGDDGRVELMGFLNRIGAISPALGPAPPRRSWDGPYNGVEEGGGVQAAMEEEEGVKDSDVSGGSTDMNESEAELAPLPPYAITSPPGDRVCARHTGELSVPSAPSAQQSAPSAPPAQTSSSDVLTMNSDAHGSVSLFKRDGLLAKLAATESERAGEHTVAPGGDQEDNEVVKGGEAAGDVREVVVPRSPMATAQQDVPRSPIDTALQKAVLHAQQSRQQLLEDLGGDVGLLQAHLQALGSQTSQSLPVAAPSVSASPSSPPAPSQAAHQAPPVPSPAIAPARQPMAAAAPADAALSDARQPSKRGGWMKRLPSKPSFASRRSASSSSS